MEGRTDFTMKQGTILSPEERLRVYELLHFMNQGFHNALTSLRQFDEFSNLLTEQRLTELDEMTREVQGLANCYLLDSFKPIEWGDTLVFGRVRQAREDAWREIKRIPPITEQHRGTKR